MFHYECIIQQFYLTCIHTQINTYISMSLLINKLIVFKANKKCPTPKPGNILLLRREPPQGYDFSL